jgi:hypothetical protein
MKTVHHDPSCNNYRYHILRIGQLDFCNGCFANRIFLAIMLPFYLWLLMSGLGSWLAVALTAYMVFQIGLVGFMALTGRQLLPLFSGVLTTLYLFGAHAVLFFGPISFDIPVDLLIIFTIVLSLPQFTMYLWKIRNAEEFRYPIAKLLIRLTFVHGYLLAVLLTRYEPITGLAIIIVTATIFIVVRTLSSRNATEEHSVCNARNYGHNLGALSSGKSGGQIIVDTFWSRSLVDDTTAKSEDCCTGLCCGAGSMLCCGGCC